MAATAYVQLYAGAGPALICLACCCCQCYIFWLPVAQMHQSEANMHACTQDCRYRKANHSTASVDAAHIMPSVKTPLHNYVLLLLPLNAGLQTVIYVDEVPCKPELGLGTPEQAGGRRNGCCCMRYASQ